MDLYVNKNRGRNYKNIFCNTFSVLRITCVGSISNSSAFFFFELTCPISYFCCTSDSRIIYFVCIKDQSQHVKRFSLFAKNLRINILRHRSNTTLIVTTDSVELRKFSL